jgi:hypothetical protein
MVATWVERGGAVEYTVGSISWLQMQFCSLGPVDWREKLTAEFSSSMELEREVAHCGTVLEAWKSELGSAWV